MKIAKKRGGRATPEDRLPPAIWGGILIVIGLAGFAATDSPTIHWIAPIIFGVPFGLGVIVVFLAVLGYLIDSYTIYAASVLAANSVLRSLFGAAFPLFTTYMYERLGIHWAAALPGFIALAMIPFTVLFYKYGAQIRAKCKYAADAERQMALIMAARMAQAKRDVESTDASEGSADGADKAEKEAPVGAAATAVNVAGEDEKAPEAFPAEQAGGEGTLAEHAKDEVLRATLSHGSTVHQPHEWTEYEALADRDEVDLSDDERLRLEDLHKKFDYARATQRGVPPVEEAVGEEQSAGEETAPAGTQGTLADFSLEKPIA